MFTFVKTIALVVVIVLICLLLACVLVVVAVHRRRRKSARPGGLLRWLCCKGQSDSEVAVAEHQQRRLHESSGLPDADLHLRETIPLRSSNIVDNSIYFSQTETSLNNTVAVRRIPRNKMQIVRELGEGAFGRVYLGTCDILALTDDVKPSMASDNNSTVIEVAIKTLKDGGSQRRGLGGVEGGTEAEPGESALLADEREFQREAELLAGLCHDNIIRFYGVCEDGEHMMLVLEYMPNGDLNKYLRTHGPEAELLMQKAHEALGQLQPAPVTMLDLRELLYISRQVSAGAEYLAQHHFIHRDLATRNCLVGNQLTVKIGDFGMSRDIYSTDYYKVSGSQAVLPIRWMPSESILYRTFTVESDVWSFGVVLWEIFSYGKQPWYELSNCEVIRQVVSGETLDRPPGCPDAVYQLMLGCWHRQPQDRLTIKEISQCLDLLDQASSSPPTSPGISHGQTDKHAAVAFGNASQSLQQQSTPTTVTPNVPYLELISASATA